MRSHRVIFKQLNEGCGETLRGYHAHSILAPKHIYDVAEIFRTPDAEAALYFATIILTDPPTSPPKYPDQIVYGLIVAVISFAIFEATGVVYYLLAGLLPANLWEAWRRVSRRTPARR